MSKCPICGRELEQNIMTVVEDKRIYSDYVCDNCGSFYGRESFITGCKKETLFYLSCYLFENKDLECGIKITQTLVKKVEKYKDLSLDDKITKLLTFVNKNTKFFGQPISLKKEVTYSQNIQELNNIIDALKDKKYIEDIWTDSTGDRISLTMEGIEYLHKKTEETQKDKCFVAMWFDNKVNVLFEEGIKPACIKAGYEPIRVDKDQYNGDITAALSQILKLLLLQLPISLAIEGEFTMRQVLQEVLEKK